MRYPCVIVPRFGKTKRNIILLSLLRGDNYALVINFAVGTGSHTFDNAADVCLAETVIVQFVKPSLVASFGIKFNAPKKTGKSTHDIKEQISTSLIGSLAGLIRQSDLKMSKSGFTTTKSAPKLGVEGNVVGSGE